MLGGFVYKWTNLLNGKWYIGSHAGNPSDNYIGSGNAFKDALEKHGLHNFKRDILYVGTEFKTTEEWYLSNLNAKDDPLSYNLTNSAFGWNKGEKHTEEARRKISIGNKGKKKGPMSAEQKLKISLTLKGRPKSKESTLKRIGVKRDPEIAKKVAIAQKGKFVSAESRAKMSAAHKGQKPWNKGIPHSEEAKKKMSASWNYEAVRNGRKPHLRLVSN